MFFNKKRNRFGFTLVEVMITVTILSIITYVMWNIFITFRKMNEVSTWQSARQIELKTALKLIRTDLQEASYPTVVTRVSSEFVESDAHGLTFKPGGPFVIDSATAGDYLRFYMCKPLKRVFPDGDPRNSNGYVAECVVSFEGTNLRYRRTLSDVPGQGAAFSANDIQAIDKILVQDVSAFDIGVVAATSSEANLNFCTMTVTCFHPNPNLNSNVTERTGTKIEVAADPAL